MKRITTVILLLLVTALMVSCMIRSNAPANANTQTSDTTAPAETEDTSEPEQIGRDFKPVAGKKYVAYVYVEYVSNDGFAGDGNFNDGVYVLYPGAKDDFRIFDTVRIVFDGADYKVEDKTLNGNDPDFGAVITKQTITKVISARRSDYEAGEPVYDKPIIYLYPEKDAVCTVKLEISGGMTCSYPQYTENGWANFTAKPDGTLIFPDGGEYYALYWEGNGMTGLDMSKGFCVKGTDTAAFLSDILPRLGLSAKEANEFIIYWLPRMQNNAYNLISFQTTAYTDNAKLTVTPEPDMVIRVFMAYKPMQNPVEIRPQTIETPHRFGFTVVEWGGAEIK